MTFKGVCTALITPFTKGNQVDYQGLRNHIEFQIESKVAAILLNGTTAEAPTLSQEEQEKIIQEAIYFAKDRVHVMVGCGTNCTDTTIERTKRVQKLGADSALIVTPYYNKPTQEGIFRHFEMISQEVDLPIYVYNIPGRTAQNIAASTFAKLMSLPNICGVKESSQDLHQIAKIISLSQIKKKSFSVLSGDDILALPIISLGGHGVVSVLSNAVPHLIVNLVEAALVSDLQQAQKLYYELLPLIEAAFIETNPIGIKYIMSKLGLPSGNLRLPLCEMESANKNIVDKMIRGLLCEKFV